MTLSLWTANAFASDIAYNLAERGLSTDIRDQKDWNTGWSFGTMGAIESNVLVQLGTSGNSTSATPDYSELALALFSHTPREWTKDGVLRTEGVKVTNEGRDATVAEILKNGGDRELAIAELAAWGGPVSEVNMPYITTEEANNFIMDETLRDFSEVHLQNAHYLKDPSYFDFNDEYQFDEAANNTIKNEILKNGAVQMSYHADDYGVYYNSVTNAQYTCEYQFANHTATIVGWDDSYSKENFIMGRQPSENGAWIVKDSRGENKHKEGYLYISYYDQALTEFTSYQVDIADKDGKFTYDNNYQYDFLGQASYLWWISDEIYGEFEGGNIFVPNSYENLTAVSAITAEPNSVVTTKIYKNCSADNPMDGELVHTQDATLLGSLGCNLPIYLYGTARGVNHERLDERRKYDDCLLLRWNKTGNF